jgi:GTPase
MKENYYLVSEISNCLSASMIEKASFSLVSFVDITGKEFFSETKLKSILPKEIFQTIKTTCTSHTLTY